MPFRFQRRLKILSGTRAGAAQHRLSSSPSPRTLPGGGPGANGPDSPGISDVFLDAPERRPAIHPLASGAVGFVLGALALWVLGHLSGGAKPAIPEAPQATARQTGAQPVPQAAGYGGDTAAHYPVRAHQPKLTAAPIPGPRYVHRAGAVLRVEAKTSGDSLKKESKGAKVTLQALQDDGWAKVTDGNIHGWMRASTLGVNPP
jgi:hypothetical protein